MRVLFLPNFRVERLCEDDPTVRSPNKVVAGARYWFFNHTPSIEAQVLDDWAPKPMAITERISGIRVCQALRAVKDQGRHDVVLSHSYNSGFVFSMIRSLRHERNPPHFVIDIGCLNGGRSNHAQIALIRKSLESVAGIIYHSSINEEFYSCHFPELRRQFVPFGVDTEFFNSMKKEPRADYVLSVGSRFRDYRTLLKAWEGVEFPLKIVGAKITDSVANKRIEGIAEVSIERLRSLIHNARFVILPIQARPYSVGQMTLLQCMAMRKPVIVTNVPGVRDYTRNGENCLTIGEGSTEDARGAALSLLEDESLSRRIGEEARRDVVERFNEKTMAFRIVSFIEDVVSTSR